MSLTPERDSSDLTCPTGAWGAGFAKPSRVHLQWSLCRYCAGREKHRLSVNMSEESSDLSRPFLPANAWEDGERVPCCFGSPSPDFQIEKYKKVLWSPRRGNVFYFLCKKHISQKLSFYSHELLRFMITHSEVCLTDWFKSEARVLFPKK